MRRGLFSFLVVLGFFPIVLYAASEHARAASRIAREKELMLEQQVLTNLENDFQDSFWRASEACVKKGKSVEGCLSGWKSRMEEKGMRVWAGEVNPNYYSKPLPAGFKPFVEASPDGKSVEVKGETPHYVIGAVVRAGSSTSLFLIPSGCSRGL